MLAISQSGRDGSRAAPCLVAGGDVDEHENLRERGRTSFWHTLMGVTLPLLFCKNCAVTTVGVNRSL